MNLKIRKRSSSAHTHPATAEVKAELISEDLVRLNVEITAAKRQKLKAKAAIDGRTVHDVINQLVNEYLQTS